MTTEIMLEVAEGLRETPGCELYLINRSVGEPDVIWVTELWHSQEQLDAALESEAARARIPEVLALVVEGGFERVDLEPLANFIHPGGSFPGAFLHQARTVCRRAERIAVTLAARETVDEDIVKYLNRLSDALFVWSRWASRQLGTSENLWEPNAAASGNTETA